jgi:hypothetical protein
MINKPTLWQRMGKMIDLLFAIVLEILFPPPQKEYPGFLGVVRSDDESVPYQAKNLGHLVMGEPGSGKTRSQAKQFVDEAIENPRDAFFLLDISGSMADDVIGYASKQRKDIWEWLQKRIIYIRLGDKNYSFPNPEFSKHYGSTYEEQIDRVTNNIVSLTGGFKSASIVGGVTLKAVLPYFLRLLTSMSHVTPYKEPFQITDLQLMTDHKKYLAAAMNKVGEALDHMTRDFLFTRILNVKKDSGELRTYALSEVHAALSSQAAIADLGYYYPVWTPKEAIEKGMIVIVDGSLLINQEFYQNYRMAQIYSMIAENINKRRPHDPRDNVVNIYIDEVPGILKNPGIAEKIQEMISMRRSRNVHLTILIQSLSQLSEDLQKNIFMVQNVTCFAGSIMDDMDAMARHVFYYDPGYQKPTVKETSEPEQGQTRQQVDFLQSLPPRSCVIKCRKANKEKDPHIYYVPKTREVSGLPNQDELEEIKQALMAKIGVRIREALKYPQERLQWLQEPPTRPTV